MCLQSQFVSIRDELGDDSKWSGEGDNRSYHPESSPSLCELCRDLKFPSLLDRNGVGRNANLVVKGIKSVELRGRKNRGESSFPRNLFGL